MINTVAMTGKAIAVYECHSYILGVIECNDEQFYIMFDKLALPEPAKILNKYISVNGVLQHFKHKWADKSDYEIVLGIFVRRLEVYDI